MMILKRIGILLLAILFCAGMRIPDQARARTPQKEPGNFQMGFVAVPLEPATPQGWIKTFDLIRQNGEVVLHHSSLGNQEWEMFAQGVDQTTPQFEFLNFISQMTVQNGLSLFLMVDPLSQNREEHTIPPGMGNNFGDPKPRQAFLNYTLRLVRDYKPRFLGLFSEVNTYVLHHPDDADHVFSLIDEVRQTVKKEFPNIQVTTSVQYELLCGTFGGNPQWQMVARLKGNDSLSITTYPGAFFDSPGRMPPDYYSKLSSFTQQPIWVAESGWPSMGNRGFRGGSIENQRQFVRAFPQLIQELDVRLWIWWFLHDLSDPSYPEQFRSMGLRTSTSVEKPSWKEWQMIRQRMASRSKTIS